MQIVYLTCNYKFKSLFQFTHLSQLNDKDYLLNFNIKKEKLFNISKKRTLNLFKKIYTVLYDKKIFTVSLDENLFENKYLKELLNEHKINIITGEKIKNILIKECLNSINCLQQENLKEYNVSILINNYNYINKFNIEYLAANCKSICLITNNKSTFLPLSNAFLDEFGIHIPIINAPPKSSNLIINIDLELNDIKLNKGSIVVDFSNSQISRAQKRNINYINNFSITVPNNLYINNFDSIQLCEAYFADYLDDVELILSKFNKEGFKIFPVK